MINPINNIMKATFSILLLVLVLGSTSAQETKGTKESGATILKERVIPVPEGASEEMQESLIAFPPPPIETVLIYPQTLDEWNALIESRDEQTAANAAILAEQFEIDVKKERINGVTVRYVIPKKIAPKYSNSLFVHLHGGAYILNGGDASVVEALFIAQRIGIQVISIDYRMPPAHPFPAGLNDAVNAYKGILDKYPEHTLFMGGTSAGGALTMSATSELKEQGVLLPRALFIGTPGSDLTKTGDSYYINEGIDRLLVAWEGLPEAAIDLYVGNNDPKNPLLSPVYGDFEGFPPSMLVSGTRDLLLSNTVRSHRKLRDAGVEADLVVIEGHSHADYFVVANSPESIAVFKDLDNFMSKYINEE